MGMKTSSISGIKDVIKQQKENIKIAFSDEDIQITNEEAETLYQLYEDKDAVSLSDYMPSSLIQALIVHAKKQNMSKQQFLKTVMMHGIDSSNDVDIRRSLTNIYNKYVK